MYREGKLRGGESSSKGRQKQTDGCFTRHCLCHCKEKQNKSLIKGRHSTKTSRGFTFRKAYRAKSLAQLSVDFLVENF